MPHCPHCGNELTGSESHCPACGQPTAAPAPPSEPSATRGTAPLPLEYYFKTGWGLFKQYHTGFVGFGLLILAIQVVLNTIPYLGAAVLVLVNTPLLMGNFIVSAKLLQGQTPEFRDFFLGFQYTLPLVLLSLVAAIFVGIGMALLVIPGVYLAVSYLFAAYLVVDRRLDFWAAMELSRTSIGPQWFRYFGLALLLALLNVAGLLLLGLGLAVSIPVSVCVMTVAYADLFGMETKEY
jgi:uncharacterized membrane protein